MNLRSAIGLPSDDQGSPDSFSAVLAELLQSVEFPTTTDCLRDAARGLGAGNELSAALHGLPEREYQDADDVTTALGNR
ncbi:DUF2795 domain-containing protein [Chitinasiproducens palmae]|uniref:DUF2795 domain-containing protein n=1 Tax=Chitinasiproducens palmae TaxID=1770053 RepID=A0A1H2PVW8_9BURK|nr:DUF2795 domain-containing protein [Chitinasiproducens palmae]SDV51441.1 Protein of unknown function [Chitinasiproducens palmae]